MFNEAALRKLRCDMKKMSKKQIEVAARSPSTRRPSSSSELVAHLISTGARPVADCRLSSQGALRCLVAVDGMVLADHSGLSPFSVPVTGAERQHSAQKQKCSIGCRRLVWTHCSTVALRLRSITVLVDNRFDPVTHPVHQIKYDWYQGGRATKEGERECLLARGEGGNPFTLALAKERERVPRLACKSRPLSLGPWPLALRGGLLRAVQFHSLGPELTYLAAVDVFPRPTG